MSNEIHTIVFRESQLHLSLGDTISLAVGKTDFTRWERFKMWWRNQPVPVARLYKITSIQTSGIGDVGYTLEGPVDD